MSSQKPDLAPIEKSPPEVLGRIIFFLDTISDVRNISVASPEIRKTFHSSEPRLKQGVFSILQDTLPWNAIITGMRNYYFEEVVGFVENGIYHIEKKNATHHQPLLNWEGVDFIKNGNEILAKELSEDDGFVDSLFRQVLRYKKLVDYAMKAEWMNNEQGMRARYNGQMVAWWSQAVRGTSWELMLNTVATRLYSGFFELELVMRLARLEGRAQPHQHFAFFLGSSLEKPAAQTSNPRLHKEGEGKNEMVQHDMLLALLVVDNILASAWEQLQMPAVDKTQTRFTPEVGKLLEALDNIRSMKSATRPAVFGIDNAPDEPTLATTHKDDRLMRRADDLLTSWEEGLMRDYHEMRQQQKQVDRFEPYNHSKRVIEEILKRRSS